MTDSYAGLQDLYAEQLVRGSSRIYANNVIWGVVPLADFILPEWQQPDRLWAIWKSTPEDAIKAYETAYAKDLRIASEHGKLTYYSDYTFMIATP